MNPILKLDPPPKTATGPTNFLRSIANPNDDREDLVRQISRLKLDLDIYKSKCKELEIQINSQANQYKRVFC